MTFLRHTGLILQENWELARARPLFSGRNFIADTISPLNFRDWQSHILLLGLAAVCVVMYYICHHISPKPPPLFALLYCSMRSKTHESCCLPVAPFHNTVTCAELEIIIQTQKGKNHKATGLLPDSTMTFLKLKSNILSNAALYIAELQLCMAHSELWVLVLLLHPIQGK